MLHCASPAPVGTEFLNTHHRPRVTMLSVLGQAVHWVQRPCFVYMLLTHQNTAAHEHPAERLVDFTLADTAEPLLVLVCAHTNLCVVEGFASLSQNHR